MRKNRYLDLTSGLAPFVIETATGKARVTFGPDLKFMTEARQQLANDALLLGAAQNDLTNYPERDFDSLDQSSDKATAMLVTAALITPICSFCLLGPAVLTGYMYGLLGWIGGLSPLVIVGLGVITAICVWRRLRRRSGRSGVKSNEAARGHCEDGFASHLHN